MKHEYVFEKHAGEKAFYFSDGKKIYTIRELYESLDNLNDDILDHHVNKDRNDFSNWIRDVFEEKELAKKIEKIHEKSALKKELREWISEHIHKKHKEIDLEHKKKNTVKKKSNKAIKNNHSTIKKHDNIKNQKKEFFKKIELTILIDFVLGFILGAIVMIIALKLL